jgi:hypothetical protein
MLQGIENTQTMVIMPRILASGEMDVFWEVGFAYRVLGFLKDQGDNLLEAISLENRDYRALLREVAPKIRASSEGIHEEPLRERYRQWAQGLASLEVKENRHEVRVSIESVYEESASLKSALHGLLILLNDTDPDAASGANASDRDVWEEKIKKTLKRAVARHHALSEAMLEAASW